jgi:hypothetical protein
VEEKSAQRWCKMSRELSPLHSSDVASRINTKNGLYLKTVVGDSAVILQLNLGNVSEDFSVWRGAMSLKHTRVLRC